MLDLAEQIVEILAQEEIDIAKVKELIIELAYKVEDYEEK